MRTTRRGRAVGGVLLVGALAAGGGAAAALLDGPSEAPAAVAPSPSPSPSPADRGDLLPAADEGAAPGTAGLEAAVAQALADPALGGSVAVSVVDAVTGDPLLQRAADVPVVPASTTKVATAVAALTGLPDDLRLRTRVVAGAAPGEVVLVGGGDPTLAGPSTPVRYPQPARLADLAAQARAALGATAVTRVVVDDAPLHGRAPRARLEADLRHRGGGRAGDRAHGRRRAAAAGPRTALDGAGAAGRPGLRLAAAAGRRGRGRARHRGRGRRAARRGRLRAGAAARRADARRQRQRPRRGARAAGGARDGPSRVVRRRRRGGGRGAGRRRRRAGRRAPVGRQRAVARQPRRAVRRHRPARRRRRRARTTASRRCSPGCRSAASTAPSPRATGRARPCPPPAASGPRPGR